MPPHDEYITQSTEQLTIYQVLKERLPPWDEYIMQFTEQLVIATSPGEPYLFHDTLQQPDSELDVLDVESSTFCQPDLSNTHPITSLVVNND